LTPLDSEEKAKERYRISYVYSGSCHGYHGFRPYVTKTRPAGALIMAGAREQDRQDTEYQSEEIKGNKRSL